MPEDLNWGGSMLTGCRPAYLLMLAALSLVGAARLGAQIELSIQPRLSSFLPVTNVYDIDRALGSDSDPWDREVSTTTIARSPALSLAVQLGDATLGWALRAGITRSVGSTTRVHGLLDPPPPGLLPLGPPPDPGESFEFRLPTTLTVSFAEAVLPLLLGTPSIRPYVSVGLAVKSYRFDPFDPLACEAMGGVCNVVDFKVPPSGTVVGAQVGAGVMLSAWGRQLEIGLVDTINPYLGRDKHDLNAFLGVTMAVLH